MKKINFIILLTTLLTLLFSCKKKSTIVVPILKDATVGYVTAESAASQCEVASDGGSAVTAKGVCWSIHSVPQLYDFNTSDGTGNASFISNLTNLLPNTTYYLRPYATNSAGVGYGKEISFKTLLLTLTDADGNVYHAITIGTQTFMMENLKVTHYRNGDPIPNVTDNTAWNSLTTGAYCDYNNSPANSATYGRLYNYAAVRDSRNIAPAGWHTASEAEWCTLIIDLGGLPWDNTAGVQLKETGTTHWLSPNTGATNKTEFTALPAGQRWLNFEGMGYTGVWWCSDEYIADPTAAWSFVLLYNSVNALVQTPVKLKGLSVRCVKDN